MLDRRDAILMVLMWTSGILLGGYFMDWYLNDRVEPETDVLLEALNKECAAATLIVEGYKACGEDRVCSLNIEETFEYMTTRKTMLMSCKRAEIYGLWVEYEDQENAEEQGSSADEEGDEQPAKPAT